MVEISVIVPVYNSEKYLVRCMDSLVSQSINNYEIVIINDGSNDNSLNIIKKYEEKYENIRVISTKNNGIGIARNIGIKNSNGKYITFVDSDDYISRDYLNEMLINIKKENADIAICDKYRVYDGKELEDEKIIFKNGNINSDKEQLIKIPLGPCGKVFKREIIKQPFAEKLKYEDVPFVALALVNSNKTIKINKYLYYYVIHEKSETTSMDERVFDILEILKMVNSNVLSKKELYKELEYLNIMLLCRYNLQQKNQKSRLIRKKFLNETFQFLNNNFPAWKKNVYFNREPLLKRIIKKNKSLIKIYWFIN